MKTVKKKKKKLGVRSFGGGAGREMSPLRPKHKEWMPPCRDTCPSGNRIREFLTTISHAEREGRDINSAFATAWEIYTDTSPFPATCGRVCPAPCETGCNRKELEGAVGINMVERSIGDFGIEHDLKLKKLTDETRTQTIGVVGGGPSGFSCAYQLARRGYGVTVYEATEKPGGMLVWGIPGYRLPERVLMAEVQKILDLGVELKCGVKVGRDVSMSELKARHDAVYVAIGAQQGVQLGVDGEDAPNVFSGVDFLSRFHHGEQLHLGKDVVVIIVGGGDTAIDAARICKRLGANVTILYRRTRAEMPAIDHEVDAALEEGINIEFLAAPTGFRKENGMVVAMTAIRMELGEPDSSGRRRPVPLAGSEFELPASAVISAVSQSPDFSGFESLIEGKDWIRIDDQGATKEGGVWAGGDAVALDLMTTAVGHGRRAAEAIERSFLGLPAPENGLEVIHTAQMDLSHYGRMERAKSVELAPDERLNELEKEVSLGLSREAVVGETRRCMSCGYCFDCEKCWLYCQDQAINKPMEKGVLYGFNLQNCTGCKKCAEICPCGFIVMV